MPLPCFILATCSYQTLMKEKIEPMSRCRGFPNWSFFTEAFQDEILLYWGKIIGSAIIEIKMCGWLTHERHKSFSLTDPLFSLRSLYFTVQTQANLGSEVCDPLSDVTQSLKALRDVRRAGRVTDILFLTAKIPPHLRK